MDKTQEHVLVSADVLKVHGFQRKSERWKKFPEPSGRNHERLVD